MTGTDLEPTRSSGTVATTTDAAEGLEDFDFESDSVMPRLKIIGKDAEFEDNLTGERYPEITVILLGLVKQRILWPEDVTSDSKPLCRSNNFTEGEPYIRDFPWKASGFPEPERGVESITLACNDCALKEWGSNPKGSTPWCSEQHTYPLLLQTEVGWLPAILTLQRSGIKASKAYTTAFARSKTPLYTQVTRITLQAMKQGTVDYAVPTLIKTAPTDPAHHAEYAQQYRTIRAFLQSPRAFEEQESSGSSSPASSTAPATASATPPASVAGDDDEPPF